MLIFVSTLIASAGAAAVPPTERTADMPDSWLVLYNANVTESAAWAAWYADQWGIPVDQRLGLPASTAEHLADDAAFESQIAGPLRAFLQSHPDVAARTMGFVVGYALPGHFGDVKFSVGGRSVACALHDMNDEAFNVNPDTPHLVDRVLPAAGRLTRARMSPDHFLCARLDGPDLDAVKQLTLRAKALRSGGPRLPGHCIYADFQDVVLPSGGVWMQLRTAFESPDFADLPWRLFESDVESTPNDFMRFDTHDVANWANGRLGGTPAGPRILAYNLNSWGATTVRSITDQDQRFVPNALDNGYAAAIGATGEPSSVVGPYVDTLLAGLRQGWTLGETFYLANPYDDFMWTLVGDPFLRVPDWSSSAPNALAEDADGDGDVDLVDFDGFLGCYGRSTTGLPADSPCAKTDFDADGDTDVSDFARFQACFNGPNRPAACEN